MSKCCKVYFLLTAFLYTSCNLITFSDETVNCNVPDNTSAFEIEHVDFIFSGSCNRIEAEECISILENNKTVVAEYCWKNNILGISPKSGWKKGFLYQVTFDGNLKINDQRIYANIIRCFYYGKTNMIPEVSVGSIVYPDEINSTFEMTFTKKMNDELLENKVRVYPSLKCKIEFDDANRKLRVEPLENWKAGVSYRINISGLVSADYYHLADREYSFSIRPCEDNPRLIKTERLVLVDGDYVVLEGKSGLADMECSDAIGFTFSKTMNVEFIEKYLSISPYAEGSIITMEDKKYAFVTTARYKANQQYEITLGKNISDVQGNKMNETKKLYFTPKIQYLKILNLRVDSTEINLGKQERNSHGFYPEKREVNINDRIETFYSCSIMITFSRDFKKEEYKSTVDNIKLELKFPLTISNPVLKRVSWLTANRVMIEYENIVPSSKDEPVYYKLTIKGGENGIKNHLMEYLEEDECFYLEPLSE